MSSFPSDQPPEPIIRPDYRAFLLRCWQEGSDGRHDWRFTIVYLADGQIKHGFASLDEVFAYLQNALSPPLSAADLSLPQG